MLLIIINYSLKFLKIKINYILKHNKRFKTNIKLIIYT